MLSITVKNCLPYRKIKLTITTPTVKTTHPTITPTITRRLCDGV